jgi:hypothetical protein
MTVRDTADLAVLRPILKVLPVRATRGSRAASANTSGRFRTSPRRAGGGRRTRCRACHGYRDDSSRSSVESSRLTGSPISHPPNSWGRVAPPSHGGTPNTYGLETARGRPGSRSHHLLSRPLTTGAPRRRARKRDVVVLGGVLVVVIATAVVLTHGCHSAKEDGCPEDWPDSWPSLGPRLDARRSSRSNDGSRDRGWPSHPDHGAPGKPR